MDILIDPIELEMGFLDEASPNDILDQSLGIFFSHCGEWIESYSLKWFYDPDYQVYEFKGYTGLSQSHDIKIQWRARYAK